MAPGRTKLCTVLLAALRMTSLWLGRSVSIGVTVLGSLAALERITVLPSGETASTLPIKGSTAVTVLAAVSKTAIPALVPIYPLLPAALKTSEFGVPGKLRAVPATIGVLLVSMGTMVGVVPLGGVKELVA